MSPKKYADPEIAAAAVLPDHIAAALTAALKGKGVDLEEEETDAGAAAAAAAETGESAAEGSEAATPTAPSAPLLVFINSKSGGRLGPDLFKSLKSFIGTSQVFELSKAKPTTVLPTVVEVLDSLADGGDEVAAAVKKNLRVIVAGGDGTVGWMLSTVDDLTSPPPVAVIPLGTGNDLSRSFGWGPNFRSAAASKVKDRLKKAIEAEVANLDSWELKLTLPPDMDPSQIKLPYALHKKEGDSQDGIEYTATFYNYFSMGMDAQIAHGFHELRNEKPNVASGPTVNKLIYSSFGCTQGWFCTPCSANAQARSIHMLSRVFIKRSEEGSWEELNIPQSLRAIILLNLQSYAGGRDPWGLPLPSIEAREGWTKAGPSDSKIEIVGLRNGWHTALVMGEVSNATRIAQAHAVKFELRGEHSRSAFLQLDGEPWEELLDPDSRVPTVVEITRRPKQSLMLKTPDKRGEGPEGFWDCICECFCGCMSGS